MSYASIQAAYAAHGVATYPLSAAKKPAIKAYDRVGIKGGAQLALKFSAATAAGFVAGPRNRLTVIDIDSVDDNLVAEIQRRFGTTPLQVITPSGGRHLYYRHNNERRGHRFLPNVDLLGAGNVVAAGSITPKGRYEIERGTLDDLDRLPPVREAITARQERPATVRVGQRNVSLFKHCRSIAGFCDDLDQLLDAARTWAEGRLEKAAEPMSDAEIVKTATSAWNRRGGGKLFMQHIVDGPLFPQLIADPEVWTVCSYLMIEQGPAARFMIADGLGEARGWPRRMVPTARKALLKLGIVKCVRRRGNGLPALYRWCTPDSQNSPKADLPESVGNTHTPSPPYRGAQGLGADLPESVGLVAAGAPRSGRNLGRARVAHAQPPASPPCATESAPKTTLKKKRQISKRRTSTSRHGSSPRKVALQ